MLHLKTKTHVQNKDKEKELGKDGSGEINLSGSMTRQVRTSPSPLFAPSIHSPFSLSFN